MFTRKLAELMDNVKFQRENLEQSMAAFGITMEIRPFKPLRKPTQLQPYLIIAVNRMAEKEKNLAKSV